MATSQDAIDDLLDRAREISRRADPIHSHADLERITRTCDLSAYYRNKELQTLYDTEFNPALKRTHGTVEAFLLQRLDWTKQDMQLAQGTGLYFTRAIDERHYRIRLNDWQYSIPKDYEHWLVWTLLPLIDWKDATPFVQQHGIAGQIVRKDGVLLPQIVGPGNHTEPVCIELEAFISSRWPEADEVFWLVNPIRLQSVPGLAHAHCFVRTRSA